MFVFPEKQINLATLSFARTIFFSKISEFD